MNANPGEKAPEPLPTLVLLSGSEEFLADRALGELKDRAREISEDTEFTELDAVTYGTGTLEAVTSPSLFGEPRFVIVDSVESASEAFAPDALAYVASPQPDVCLVLRHRGGVSGKKLVDAVKKTKGSVVVSCAPLKRESDKIAFVDEEFRAAHRKVTGDARVALVNAVGSNLGELAAACQQIISESKGVVDASVVDRYFGGRIEATAFKVADAAIAGDVSEAAALFRHGLLTGLELVLVVGALASKLRNLARVGGLARMSEADAARELGIQGWQVRRARGELRHWTPETLADAIVAVARADADAKGAARDREYAVERAVVTVSRLARRR